MQRLIFLNCLELVLDRWIDVFKFYGLNEEDIKIVEGG